MGGIKNNKSNFGGNGSYLSRQKAPAKRKTIVLAFPVGVPISSTKQLADYLSADKIQCLICGREFKQLGTHLVKGHGMLVNEYKDEFNIPRLKSLVGADLLARRQKQGKDMAADPKAFERFRKGTAEFVAENPNGVHGKKSSSLNKSTYNGQTFKAARDAQAEQQRDKFRPVYMANMREAIERGVPLGVVCHGKSVRNFAICWPDDKEYIDTLSMVPVDEHRVGANREKKCLNCDKAFNTRNLNSKYCSIKCSSAYRKANKHA